ncbi:hypothetical protein ACRAWD_31610 [Caulobacter segnis]
MKAAELSAVRATRLQARTDAKQAIAAAHEAAAQAQAALDAEALAGKARAAQRAQGAQRRRSQAPSADAIVCGPPGPAIANPLGVAEDLAPQRSGSARRLHALAPSTSSRGSLCTPRRLPPTLGSCSFGNGS